MGRLLFHNRRDLYTQKVDQDEKDAQSMLKDFAAGRANLNQQPTDYTETLSSSCVVDVGTSAPTGDSSRSTDQDWFKGF